MYLACVQWGDAQQYRHRPWQGTADEHALDDQLEFIQGWRPRI